MGCYFIYSVRASRGEGSDWQSVTLEDKSPQKWDRRHRNLPLIIKKKNVGWIYVNILKKATIVQITPQRGAKKSQMLLRHFGDMCLLLVHLFSFSC